jgi:hypothetical protein
LLVASGAVLVFKPLPSIKIWYVFGILSKKKKKRQLVVQVDDDCEVGVQYRGFERYVEIAKDHGNELGWRNQRQSRTGLGQKK